MYRGEEGKKAYEEVIGYCGKEDPFDGLFDEVCKEWRTEPTSDLRRLIGEQLHYQQGWVCGQCGGTNAPWVNRCPCVPLPAPVVTC